MMCSFVAPDRGDVGHARVLHCEVVFGASKVVGNCATREALLVSECVEDNEEATEVDEWVLAVEVGGCPAVGFTNFYKLAESCCSRVLSVARYSFGKRGVEDIDQMCWRDSADSIGCSCNAAVKVCVSWCNR